MGACAYVCEAAARRTSSAKEAAARSCRRPRQPSPYSIRYMPRLATRQAASMRHMSNAEIGMLRHAAHGARLHYVICRHSITYTSPRWRASVDDTPAHSGNRYMTGRRYANQRDTPREQHMRAERRVIMRRVQSAKHVADKSAKRQAVRR